MKYKITDYMTIAVVPYNPEYVSFARTPKKELCFFYVCIELTFCACRRYGISFLHRRTYFLCRKIDMKKMALID